MERFIPVIGILLIALILITDITAHKKLLIRRKAADWVFLCVLFCLFFGSVLFAVRNVHLSAENDDTGVYLSYRYLLLGDTESAVDVANAEDKMTKEHRALIDVMTAAAAADYESLYLTTADFIRNEYYDPVLLDICTELNDTAKTVLSGGKDNPSDLKKWIEDGFSALDIPETKDLKRFFETDKAVRGGEVSSVTEDDITFLLQSFPEERQSCICAVSYYLNTGRPEAAEKTALSFCETLKTPQDYAALAGVIMQNTYAEIESGAAFPVDAESSDYLEKADAARKKASGAAQEKKEDLLDTAADLVKNAEQVPYVRALNYIDARQWLKRDSGGFLDLQKIKLELLTGAFTDAKKNYDALVNRLPDLDDYSPVKTALIRVEAVRRILYETKNPEEERVLLSELKAAVGHLISQSCLYEADKEKESVSSVCSSLLYALLRFNKPTVNFVGVNAGSYPKLVFTADFSFMKNGIFGQEQFYKDDLTLTDSGKTVTDFNMEALVGAVDKHLAVVTGLFDYGNGTFNDTEGFKAIEEVLFGIGRDENLAEGMTLVNAALFAGGTQSGSRTAFREAVRNLDPNTDEDIAGNLTKAVSLLSGKAERERLLLILADNAEKIAALLTPEFVSSVKAAGVSVYILLLGEDTTGALLDASGEEGFFVTESGDYIAASLAGDYVRSLIRNRYRISYTCGGKTSAGVLGISFNSDGRTVMKEYETEVEE